MAAELTTNTYQEPRNDVSWCLFPTKLRFQTPKELATKPPYIAIQQKMPTTLWPHHTLVNLTTWLCIYTSRNQSRGIQFRNCWSEETDKILWLLWVDGPVYIQVFCSQSKWIRQCRHWLHKNVEDCVPKMTMCAFHNQKPWKNHEVHWGSSDMSVTFWPIGHIILNTSARQVSVLPATCYTPYNLMTVQRSSSLLHP